MAVAGSIARESVPPTAAALRGGGASPGLRSGLPPGGARRRVARARSRAVQATVQRGPTRGLRADPRHVRRGRVPATVRLVRAASSAAVVGWGADRPGRCCAVVLVPPSSDPRPDARAPLPTRRIGHVPPTSLGVKSRTFSRNSPRLPRVAPVDRALLPTLVTRPQVDITITFYFRVRVHRPGRTSPVSTTLFRPHERQPPWQHHRTTWP